MHHFAPRTLISAASSRDVYAFTRVLVANLTILSYLPDRTFDYVPSGEHSTRALTNWLPGLAPVWEPMSRRRQIASNGAG